MSSGHSGHGSAPARAALAGNPSDAYRGAVLAVTLDAWSAQARAIPADALRVQPPSRLVEACVRRFAHELLSGSLSTSIRWESSIPRDVGLAGSSALAIATLRALSGLTGVGLKPAGLAAMALAVEVNDLGIAAGPQDRIVQAFGGLVFMEFGPGGAHERLDRRLLPPLLIAWRSEAAGHSGATHASLATRHAAGEPLIHDTMKRLAAVARGARTALLEQDLKRFALCLDETFALRAGMLTLDPRCVEMVQVARRYGASANYTGSGGAIVAVSPEPGRLEAAERELWSIGCETAWA